VPVDENQVKAGGDWKILQLWIVDEHWPELVPGKIAPVELEPREVVFFEQAGMTTTLNGKGYAYPQCIRVFPENVGREPAGTAAAKANVIETHLEFREIGIYPRSRNRKGILSGTHGNT
jgi:hypothetical protein